MFYYAKRMGYVRVEEKKGEAIHPFYFCILYIRTNASGSAVENAYAAALYCFQAETFTRTAFLSKFGITNKRNKAEFPHF